MFSSSRRKSTFWTTFGCLKVWFSKVVRSDPPRTVTLYKANIGTRRIFGSTKVVQKWFFPHCHENKSCLKLPQNIFEKLKFHFWTTFLWPKTLLVPIFALYRVTVRGVRSDHFWKSNFQTPKYGQKSDFSEFSAKQKLL